MTDSVDIRPRVSPVQLGHEGEAFFLRPKGREITDVEAGLREEGVGPPSRPSSSPKAPLSPTPTPSLSTPLLTPVQPTEIIAPLSLDASGDTWRGPGIAIAPLTDAGTPDARDGRSGVGSPVDGSAGVDVPVPLSPLRRPAGTASASLPADSPPRPQARRGSVASLPDLRTADDASSVNGDSGSVGGGEGDTASVGRVRSLLECTPTMHHVPRSRRKKRRTRRYGSSLERPDRVSSSASLPSSSPKLGAALPLPELVPKGNSGLGARIVLPDGSEKPVTITSGSKSAEMHPTAAPPAVDLALPKIEVCIDCAACVCALCVHDEVCVCVCVCLCACACVCACVCVCVCVFVSCRLT